MICGKSCLIIGKYVFIWTYIKIDTKNSPLIRLLPIKIRKRQTFLSRFFSLSGDISYQTPSDYREKCVFRPREKNANTFNFLLFFIEKKLEEKIAKKKKKAHYAKWSINLEREWRRVRVFIYCSIRVHLTRTHRSFSLCHSLYICVCVYYYPFIHLWM